MRSPRAHGWPGFWFDDRHVLPRLAGFASAIASDFPGSGDSYVPGTSDPVAAAGETRSPAPRAVQHA